MTFELSNLFSLLLFNRPASEYSSPGRPLSCFVDENTPISGTNGATCGQSSDPRLAERRVRSQRHRNYMSRTHLHTPPDLPEGYGMTTSRGKIKCGLLISKIKCGLQRNPENQLFK